MVFNLLLYIALNPKTSASPFGSFWSSDIYRLHALNIEVRTIVEQGAQTVFWGLRSAELLAVRQLPSLTGEV